MVQGAEIDLFGFKVDLSPEVSAVMGRRWTKVGEPLEGFLPNLGIGMAVDGRN